MTDFSEFVTFVKQAHGHAANIPQAGATGRSVHIGIFDSASRLPETLTQYIDVRQGPEYTFLDSDLDESAVLNRGTAR